MYPGAMAAMAAAHGRLAPKKPDPVTGYCLKTKCRNVPPPTVCGTTYHWHHKCWSCGRKIVTRMSMTYDCSVCEVSAGPGYSTSSVHDYDREFAATAPSPA